MDKFHLLISYLIALASYAKDFHYYCESFGQHLFMDEVEDGLYDYIDQIKENVLLGSSTLPYSSRKYLAAAVQLTPVITENTQANFKALDELLERGIILVSEFEGATRGQSALLDDIAGHLDKMTGLTFLQMRKFGVSEAKIEHCEACSQKAVDRAKAILADIDYDKVAKTVLDYEAQNLLVAEEEAGIRSRTRSRN